MDNLTRSMPTNNVPRAAFFDDESNSLSSSKLTKVKQSDFFAQISRVLLISTTSIVRGQKLVGMEVLLQTRLRRLCSHSKLA